MNSRWMLPALVALFCILTLDLLYVSRKPLCIDSKVVEKIDRGDETVFKCTSNHHIPFSPYFTEHLPSIEARVQQIEKFLEGIEPFKTRVQIVILKNKPNYFLVKDSVIYSGEPMLEARGHLEKALIKVWYRENSQNLFAYENLFEEVYTDFLLYLAKGSLKVEDPFRGTRTKVGGSRWPQVLKSLQAYCQSPWKNSEHYQFCDQLQNQDSPLKDQVLELSLRPLIVSSWIASYKDLSFKDQHIFLRTLKDLIAEDHSPDLPLVKTSSLLNQSEPLHEGAEAIKSMTNFLTSSPLMKSSEAQRIFVTLVANHLEQYGYNQSFGGVYFDLLIVNETKLNRDSDQFKHFLALAKQNPNIKIAVKDPENLWMLPSSYPIRWSSLESIRSNRTIYSKCGYYDFNFVWQFANITDKLIIVNVCGDKKINLAGYIKEGPEAFGTQNKNISFIQFHIPSLLMRKDQLSHVNNVYDLVSRREIDNPVFQSLGWQELRWSEKAEAYQPKSYVDGIEWFKVQ